MGAIDMINQLDDLKVERDVLEQRLRHLLQSSLIRQYDAKHPRTGEYECDIEQLDEWVSGLIEFEALAQIEERYAQTVPQTRAEILDKAASIVSGEREQQYGSPENSFAMIAALWSAYLRADISDVDVAMMMAMLKIARIRSGRGSMDSFVDLAGYAACGGEIYAQRPQEG